MYKINPERPDIEMEIVHTFRYEAEEAGDARDGTMCIKLASADKRYSLICTLEDLEKLKKM